MSDLPPPAMPAGWYPDPEDVASERRWDGSRWTDEKRVGPPDPTESAGTPATAATSPKSGLGGCGIGCLGVIGFVVLIFIIVGIAGANKGDSSNDDGLAIVACENVVKNNLKAPSTASFPYVPTKSGNTISGEVDAENGFGAQIRSSFQCTVVGGSVRLDFLN